MSVETAAVLARFAIHGHVTACARYGNGHINDTYLVTTDQAGTVVRYVLQRINDRVFPRPGLVMGNIAAVLGHIAATDPDGDPRTRLSLVPSRSGEGWVIDHEGAFWRAYPFIEGSRTVEKTSRPEEAAATARAFGRFQKQLAGYRGTPLGEVIVDFHHTPKRLERLKAVAKADPCGRAKDVGPELAWLIGQEPMANAVVGAMAAGTVPLRITHNDTKINNVLFHADRDEGLCVIDLDTLMPGSSLYDFGDLVRTATATAAEDETDLSKVDSDPAYYQALYDGWLAELGGTLTTEERKLLPVGGALMTYEVGVRFLTDHLDGDKYFKIKRPGHNLDRARNQIAMAQAILRRHLR
jgi:Ser/Thr protein kinase RdoA (MazF antagonist)